MLSFTSEKKLRLVRAFLLAGWLLLIASLFWDPYSHVLTDPANLFSPFAPWLSAIQIQGQWVDQVPYALGNRVFWTMLVPLLPISFMVFGHEAWRRICPLSFVSQIPGYLGLRRMIRRFDRAAGKRVDVVPLIFKNSWLAKNALYVQFGLLILGLCMRLWFANSDRMGLALMLLGIIASALIVGVLWGGKTWCHYFCPVGVVQRIYTEPSGLLDSKPHIGIASLPQSMCRKPGRSTDISACVGCTSSCSDIDLEKSYWEIIRGEKGIKLKNIYFGFLGLIWGFYVYFYLYSGDWIYYFSGIWTHEEDQIGQLWFPGLYIDDTPIGIPKLFAVPIVLILFVFAGILLGRLLSAAYVRIREAGNPNLSKEQLTHQVLCVTAYIAILSFYTFGGRPTLNNMPLPVAGLISAVIVSLATLWLMKSLRRTQSVYQNEGLAPLLKKQLQSLGASIQGFLGARKLEELSADKICVLVTAPGLQTEQQRVVSYRALLEEFAKDHAPQLLATIRDAQARLHISKQEHQTIIKELQLFLPYGGSEGGAESTTDESRLFSLLAFRQALTQAVLDRGLKLEANVFANSAIQADILRLRSDYAVSELEWAEILDQLSASSDQDARLLRARLEELANLTALKVLLRSHRGEDARCDLAAKVLFKENTEEIKRVVRRMLATLQLAAHSDELSSLASALGSLAGSVVDEVLLESVPTQPSLSWHEVIDAKIIAAILSSDQSQQSSSQQLPVLRKILDDEGRGWGALESQILHGSNPIAASAYVVYAQFYRQEAKAIAQRKMLGADEQQYWLLAELLEGGTQNSASLSNMDKFLWLSGTPLLGQVSPAKIADIAKESGSKTYA